MNMSIRLLLIASLAPIALAACENPMEPKYTLSPAFGDAVRHNMAVQILNPEGNPDLTPPAMNGQRAAEVIEQYETSKTKPVVQQSTSKVDTK